MAPMPSDCHSLRLAIAAGCCPECWSKSVCSTAGSWLSHTASPTWKTQMPRSARATSPELGLELGLGPGLGFGLGLGLANSS